MSLRWLFLALLLVGAHGTSSHYHRSPTGFLLPDANLTPGETLTVSMKDLCTPGYTATVRNVPESRKVLVCQLYDVGACPGLGFEVDHLISLELGGSNDSTNLWPQPIHEARQKDVLENHLHKRVCAGTMDLGDAQKALASDWGVAYRAMERTR